MTRPHGPAGCRTFLFRFSIHPLLERLRLYFFHTFCGWHLCPPTINKPADAPLRGVAGLSCCTSARFSSVALSILHTRIRVAFFVLASVAGIALLASKHLPRCCGHGESGTLMWEKLPPDAPHELLAAV